MGKNAQLGINGYLLFVIGVYRKIIAGFWAVVLGYNFGSFYPGIKSYADKKPL